MGERITVERVGIIWLWLTAAVLFGTLTFASKSPQIVTGWLFLSALAAAAYHIRNLWRYWHGR